MYKSSSKVLHNNRSSSPILESKIISKLSAKSYLKIPKNSLAYYKMQSKSHSKTTQSSSKLQEYYNSKLILSSTQNNIPKPYEPGHTLILPSLRPENSLSRTNSSEPRNASQLNPSKTTTRLLNKIDIANKISPLPKLSQRSSALKNYINNLKTKRKRNKEFSATWSDNEGLCGWETDSVINPN